MHADAQVCTKLGRRVIHRGAIGPGQIHRQKWNRNPKKVHLSVVDRQLGRGADLRWLAVVGAGIASQAKKRSCHLISGTPSFSDRWSSTAQPTQFAPAASISPFSAVRFPLRLGLSTNEMLPLKYFCTSGTLMCHKSQEEIKSLLVVAALTCRGRAYYTRCTGTMYLCPLWRALVRYSPWLIHIWKYKKFPGLVGRAREVPIWPTL
jgi:hypothetical protein